MDEKQLASFIDHTLLAATATSGEIKKLCEEAKQYQVYSVSVNPRWVGLAADLLVGSGVKVDAAIGLPLGADSTKVKVAAAKDAIFAGADEIDMVADLPAIIEGDERYLGRRPAGGFAGLPFDASAGCSEGDYRGGGA